MVGGGGRDLIGASCWVQREEGIVKHLSESASFCCVKKARRRRDSKESKFSGPTQSAAGFFTGSLLIRHR